MTRFGLVEGRGHPVARQFLSAALVHRGCHHLTTMVVIAIGVGAGREVGWQADEVLAKPDPDR
jgi:hypothetical protein